MSSSIVDCTEIVDCGLILNDCLILLKKKRLCSIVYKYTHALASLPNYILRRAEFRVPSDRSIPAP